jgi:ketosteroid isomerase-like protein
MSAQDNTTLVQDAYAAFGRNDRKALLGAMSEDIDWHGVIGAGANVPMTGKRNGHAQVAKFFDQVAENIDFSRFEPREFVAERDKVVCLGRYAGKVKKTGRAFDSDFVMVFTVRNGKIATFREYMDAANITAAF